MKKIFLSVALVAVTFFSEAQLKRILDRAKEKVGSKTNEKVDKKVDDAVDGKSNDNKSNKDNNATDTAIADAHTTVGTSTIKAYSKYDFLPGEKIIGFEDFSTGSIGDFPAGWNTNASAEIVTVHGKEGRWLWLTKPGQFLFELPKELPEDFTLEFDLLHGVPINGAYFIVAFAQLSDMTQFS